jgi:hypothetical protein
MQLRMLEPHMLVVQNKAALQYSISGGFIFEDNSILSFTDTKKSEKFLKY